MTMRTVEDWEDRDRIIRYLASNLAQARLCLILGAGDSQPFGLPKWEKLIERLYSKAKLPLPPEASLQQAAEYLRLSAFRGQGHAFRAAVREALYDGADLEPEALMRKGAIVALGTLLTRSKRGAVEEVITFNFDDAFERYLRHNGVIAHSVASPMSWVEAADVIIYHAHGFVPRDASDDLLDEDLVFDQLSYSSAIGNEAHPWRQLLLSIMRRKLCLFVGVGARDGNLDSLLGRIRGENAGIREGRLFWGIRIVSQAEAEERHFEHDLWKARGIWPMIVGDYEAKLRETFYEVVQQAAEMVQRG